MYYATSDTAAHTTVNTDWDVGIASVRLDIFLLAATRLWRQRRVLTYSRCMPRAMRTSYWQTVKLGLSNDTIGRMI